MSPMPAISHNYNYLVGVPYSMPIGPGAIDAR
jgi:hypothetical protein